MEKFEAKYMEETTQFFSEYFGKVIDEIYVGIAVNIGIPEAKARKMYASKPTLLQKAGILSGMFDKIKKFFGFEIPKFRYTKRIFAPETKPMSSDQWDTFNNSLQSYWKKATSDAAEAMGITSFSLGKQTTEFRKKKKPYKNKSLFQVITDQYGGEIPKNIEDAYQKHKWNKTEKQIQGEIQSSIGMYVTQTNADIREAIRQQVQAGISQNKSPVEVASDMYHGIQKNETLMNKYSAETLKRNWSRVAATEMAVAYNSGVIAPFEDQAMESLKDASKAVYFVRTGGTCSWCSSVQGTIVRLVPRSVVSDTGDESLSSMGIKDPNTDIAIWQGKNNIGRKQKDWLIAVPAHPHNRASFEPIDLETEYYNPKTGDIEKRQTKNKYFQQQDDPTYKSKEEKKELKPQRVSDNKVVFNGNEYIAVSPEDYNDRLEKYRTEGGAIPVNTNSPSYRRLWNG
ncbi:MAG: hypothetical protein WC900_04175 [Oscillospiraceae bacterium]|jgi:hypothetical protein